VSIQPAPQLRDMSWDDIDAVLNIEQQVHSHPWTRGMFNDSLAHGYICKIYALENEIVGYAVLMPALDEVHLLDIGIAQAYQRKGLGGNLLNIIKELSIYHKFLRVILEVRRSNLAANALYRKAGFQDIGVRRDYYPAENGREDALVMEYKLQ
jgi:[ribosomal protein S18]-alanine N-acetyltransferase